jgi:hypothetical protein
MRGSISHEIDLPHMAKIPQSATELQEHLADHQGFLQDSAAAYDRGRDGEAKRLAVSLRVLFHDTSSSHSLLGQMGRLLGQFLSTAIPHDTASVMPHGGLVMVAMAGHESRYVAMLDNVPVTRWLPFSSWWDEEIFVDSAKRALTRKDLVLAVANQDGGAHVDPGLNETYARLSRHNSLGWVVSEGMTQPAIPIPKPERAAIRQIAHETLKTLVPGYQKSPKVSAPLFGGARMRMGGARPAHAPARIRVGRNDPCPCGSGRKYKKCHGAVV